jgi:hypothetical protein
MTDNLQTVSQTVIVGEAVAGEAAQVRRQLEDLINRANRSAFDIGELLHTIRKNHYYETTTFQDYTKGLSIKPRKAQYLRRIAEVFEAVGISRDRYEGLGLAKCREIASLDPEATWTNPNNPESQTPMREFIAGFVEQGNDLSLDQIKQHVRTLKGLTGENDIEVVHWPFIRSVLDNIIMPTVELTRRNIGSVAKDDEGISQDASISRCVEVWAIEYRNDVQNTGVENA